MTRAAFPRTRWTAAGPEAGSRDLPEETPVALVHDATTTAVMMATPADLEDFGVGFSLTEGLIAVPDEIAALEVSTGDLGADLVGIEVRMWLRQPASAALATRRRRLAGPTGCGLCGVDSLAEAVRPPRRVGEGAVAAARDIHAALAALAPAQELGRATRAAHAAGWWTRDLGLVAAREDVGRHNALDKLVGALARSEARMRTSMDDGLLALTSRVSVEMVQKAAALGAQIVVAVSAPTALAVRTADAAGITLVAVARDDGFEVFTRPDRISG
ncbi:formate dehydrogenase accessory sulfurtransferase FdhD [Phenylobacterium sp. SCN 70-31]|uniref:formate dehydrogenase accessory sulfurtransferase FdhD n=1 Tax=Phenylobacterium sp. SCN 70-31 TaxID=1660129 RepID=UPI00086B3B08|nr:formate dehydrogenase accessory sulfurtransferase FdhD [Phenylobacterium sp. SCN 70-31]ODT88936.1 MAG: formate dehydrogenase family accessory protein FdhD [Phenylobacterium sp. SCN 70-31]